MPSSSRKHSITYKCCVTYGNINSHLFQQLFSFRKGFNIFKTELPCHHIAHTAINHIDTCMSCINSNIMFNRLDKNTFGFSAPCNFLQRRKNKRMMSNNKIFSPAIASSTTASVTSRDTNAEEASQDKLP